MTQFDDKERVEMSLKDIFAPLMNYRRLIWYGTLAATALAILGGTIYYFRQPVRWSASMVFEPIFEGVAEHHYPNLLPFSTTDVVDPTVLDQVYDANHLEESCARDQFQSGFFVNETSLERQFLDLDFAARLADQRLSAVDRERIQAEYRARRIGMPIQYTLTWLRPKTCRDLPAVVILKSLPEVLQVWANDAENKRGVLKLHIAVLSPSVFDPAAGNHPPPVRADLIRSTLLRIITNVRDVEALPGARLVRIGKGTSLAHVRARLEDLLHVQLDPLMAIAVASMGRDAANWVEQSLAQATIEERAAKERADAYQTALREYSGLSATPTTVDSQRPQRSSDVQTIAPQIDRTFIDRIVELTAANTTFRQQLTRSMVDARIAAVETASKVDHYSQMLAALRAGSTPLLPAAEVEQRLKVSLDDAKAQVQVFNDLYEEFSRVSLRSGPTMYRVERSAQVEVVTSMTLRSVVVLVVAVFIGAVFVLSAGSLAHYAFRQLMKSTARANA